MTMAEYVHVVTWNVNGLLDKIRRGAILRHAKRLGADILMIQETHLMGNKTPFLARYGFSQVYHAGFTRGSRGVAILIWRHVSLKMDTVQTDRLGRSIMISGVREGRPCSLCCVYAPPIIIGFLGINY